MPGKRAGLDLGQCHQAALCGLESQFPQTHDLAGEKDFQHLALTPRQQTHRAGPPTGQRMKLAHGRAGFTQHIALFMDPGGSLECFQKSGFVVRELDHALELPDDATVNAHT